MDKEGVVLEGLVAAPEVTTSEDSALHTSMAQPPTESHALATAEQDEKGMAQLDHDQDVLDLGWNEKIEDIPGPLVGGMSNEDLWILVRRFNKVRL